MILIQELKQIKPNDSIVNFDSINPTLSEMQKTYQQQNKSDVSAQTVPAQPIINVNKQQNSTNVLQKTKPIISESKHL